jgi:beta-galactosidase
MNPAKASRTFTRAATTPFQADLTPAVKFGAKNLLAIRVYKNTKAVDLDTGDYFLMGGIHRSVMLFSVPKIGGLDDLTVRTTVSKDRQRAELRVLLHAAGAANRMKATITWQDQPPIDATADESGRFRVRAAVGEPAALSAEHPNLYTLDVDVKDPAGRTIQHVQKKIGVREVSIENGVMMVNHVPVKFTGICRHELWPTVGSALGPEQWRKEIELMKAANINSIRTSHYPYAAGFYDLCDEMGMYVADELAACWVPCDTDELTDAFAQHAREYVQRDKNHPSVVIWAIGNENKQGKNNGVAAREIQKIDPTRPRLVSQHESNDLEGNVELDDLHYTTPDKIAKENAAARRKKFPRTYLENPNVWEVRNGADWGSLDLWAAVIDRTWKEVWKDEHIPGSWLWEWQDRAVADKSPVKLWDFYPKTGINLVKVKGLGRRLSRSRPDYYAVKVVYAPIKVDLKPTVSDGAVVIKATNHLSFTDLSELKTTWHAMRGGKD